MNDEIQPLPRASMPRDSFRLALVAIVVIVLVGGLHVMIPALCIIALVLYLAGWDLQRTRAAARDFREYVFGN